MTPQEWNNLVEKQAEKYCPDRIVDLPNGEKLNVIHSKKTGFVDGIQWTLDNLHHVPQVSDIKTRLENAIYHQEQSKNYLEHHERCNIEDYDMPEDEACMCGLDSFSHNNHLSIEFSKQALSNLRGNK